MINLEYINKKIIILKEHIQYLDGIFDRLNDDTKDFFESCTGLKELKEELKTLEQIKDILEAWEVVKRKGFIFTKEEKNLLIGNTWNIYRLSSRELNNKEYETLKKALEIKDKGENK